MLREAEPNPDISYGCEVPKSKSILICHVNYVSDFRVPHSEYVRKDRSRYSNVTD